VSLPGASLRACQMTCIDVAIASQTALDMTSQPRGMCVKQIPEAAYFADTSTSAALG
jgi:hypothetical protein